MEDLGIVWQWQPMLIAVIMMALDMIFGFAGACKNNDIRSDKMREGLWHKAGFCGLIILAFIYEVGSTWINFEAGVADLGVTMPILPAVTAICLFVVATEIVSILENLCELNPKIAKLPVFDAFKPHDSDSADVTVDVRQPIDIKRIDNNAKEGTD